MKVLIVDDNHGDRSLLRYILEHHGCSQVVEAVDGVEGLAMASLHQPDLIVSDALMPHMDGFQFLRAVKMNETLKPIPFLFYSAVYTGFKEEELALSLGAEAFIVKPKDPEELWVLLATIMKNHASGKEKTSLAGLQEVDEEFIRKYGEIVTAKLEEKIRELENALARRDEAVTALETHFAQFRRIFDSINAVVFVAGIEEGRLLFLNKHGCQLWGADWAGKTCSEFLPEGYSQVQKSNVAETLPEGALAEHPCTWEFRATPADKWYQFMERIIPWTDGRPVRLVVGFDISERKEIERVKDEMISAVSHELRTPLTAMMGFTELLLNNEVPPGQQKEYLKTILFETEKLHELINNFLTLQQLQTRDQRPADFFPVDMGAVLEDIAGQYRTRAKKHRITLECPRGLDPILGNKVDLRLMMDNLVSNAVKFSPDGGEVFVGVHQQEGAMTIVVKDEGIGIPPDMMDKIFELFYQVDGTDSRRFCGTGLGLALAREIVKAHGGQIWAESTEGQGSSLYVSLPVHNQTADGDAF
jgi:PAS domain S-box-containing protein